jgi:hypothetical protein
VCTDVALFHIQDARFVMLGYLWDLPFIDDTLQRRLSHIALRPTFNSSAHSLPHTVVLHLVATAYSGQHGTHIVDYALQLAYVPSLQLTYYAYIYIPWIPTTSLSVLRRTQLVPGVVPAFHVPFRWSSVETPGSTDFASPFANDHGAINRTHGYI